MLARFTDAGAELMMKQIVKDDNPFYMEGGQGFMRYDAISLTIDKQKGTLVTFHWKRKAIYTMTANHYFGRYGDTLQLSGVTGQMSIHHTN